MEHVRTNSPCVCCSFLCAICRILCFTCIRRSCPCCFKPGPQERTQVNILCLGLEAAGKTTLLSIVAGEPTDNIQPTMGFAIKTVNVKQHLLLNFQELGGSDQIRMYWDRYYTGKHLIMYVIDSSCSEQELVESHGVLTQCLSSPSLSQLPLVLVCTKHDLPSSKDINEIKEQLKVGQIECSRRVAVISCSSENPQATKDSVTQSIEKLIDTEQYK